jgi:methionyl-tRNA formyltransferase
MQMDEGLDTGGVYTRQAAPITSADTTGTLHDQLAAMGAALLSEHLSQIVSGSLQPYAQSEDGVTYASKITSEEARLNWTLPAVDLARAVRAFNPFPGAYTLWRGKRLKILAAQPCSAHETDLPEPGVISTALEDRLEIATGSGVLRIDELQLEGKRRMETREFLNGSPLFVGDRVE